MPDIGFNAIYLTQLNEIIELIESNKIKGADGALEKFKTHVSKVINVGAFSKVNWNPQWRKKTYKFGQLVARNETIGFLSIIDKIYPKIQKEQQEVLDFYRSEIEYNYLPTSTINDRFKSLVDKYPYNPEFKHSYAQLLGVNNDFEDAILILKSIRDTDPNYEIYGITLFNTYKHYIDKLLEEEKYEESLILCKHLIKDGSFKSDITFHNYLITMSDRVKDYIAFDKKVKQAENAIQHKVETESKKWQYRTIEILSFFSAVIALIFSTISTAEKTSTINEALTLNIGLGLTLILF